MRSSHAVQEVDLIFLAQVEKIECVLCVLLCPFSFINRSPEWLWLVSWSDFLLQISKLALNILRDVSSLLLSLERILEQVLNSRILHHSLFSSDRLRHNLLNHLPYLTADMLCYHSVVYTLGS